MQGSGDRRRKEGARLGGERTLRVPPSCSFPVSHSGGPHVVSFVAGRRPCARGARVRAGVARRAAESGRVSWRLKACRKKEEEKVPAKEGQRTKVQDKKESCVRAVGLGSAMAAASLCLRSDPSNASPVQGARGAPLLCGGGNCRRVRVRCVVLAMMMCGNVAAGTRARASQSGRVSGGVWQYEHRWRVAPS